MAVSSRILFCDLETYGAEDLAKAGLYKYVEDPAFEVLLIQYAWGDGPVRVIDMTGPDAETQDELQDFLSGLYDPHTVKIAHNCAFERTCLSRYTGRPMPIAEWEDTMIMAAMHGLPQSLEGAGSALNIAEQKIKEGAELIRYFCKPCAPTKANGGRTRNLPRHDPERWERFKAYGLRDVEAERAIYKRLKGLPITAFERRVREVDAAINERGVLVDTDLARAAVELDSACREKAEEQMRMLTGMDNPNSVAQLKDWLAGRGLEVESLAKSTLSEIKATTTDPDIRQAMELRQRLGKTSIKKYESMLTAATSDNRVRGIMQYYGAARTGRWAGRIVQPQNLPQNHLDDLDWIRELVKQRDLSTLELLYDNVSDVLSQLIRTALIAKPGHTLLVADYSAIEARVIAYLAGEQWRLEAFAAGKDIYCASASAMFGVPVEKHGINGHLRQKGKIAELACIAKGQLVLTDHGEKPIETVTTNDRLWDGVEWVTHDGVICRGEKEVISYGGLEATADHVVWAEINGAPRSVQFGDAAASGAHLLRTGESSMGNTSTKLPEPKEVYDIVNAGPRHRFTVSNVLVHNCGYGGGVGALKAFGADKMGLTEDEMRAIVDQWRLASPTIPRLWREVESAARAAINTPGRTFTLPCRVSYFCDNQALRCRLPSGRYLSYWAPRVDEKGIQFMGVNQTTRKWEPISTWGGKLVENCVQAFARDCLATALVRLEDAGLQTVFHVHDEVVVEAIDGTPWQSVADIMSRPIDWAPGLMLPADGYETKFYKKD